MTLRNILIATLFFSSTIHAENSIGIDINSDDVEVLASVNLNTLADYANGTTYILDTSYLRSDGDNLTRIGFSGQNRLQGIEGLTLAFGLKGVFASDFLAFPLMAKATYELPLKDSIPTTSLSLNLAYAPSVLSFRDADNYSDFRLEADMEVISNIHLFTGYRNISTNYNSNDKTFNNSFYGGLKLSF
ncbi:MAG TPA: hypothetical protein ENK68_02700 [Epsilonproteobacteria bacterium]|nr:hypothetical protein [Campylobacterota bacterium]